jgi:hypothetical protein
MKVISLFLSTTLLTSLNASILTAEWGEKMHQAAIAESWLRFIKTNRSELGRVAFKDELANSLVSMLEQLCHRLCLNSGLSNTDLVVTGLDGVNSALRRMERRYALVLGGKEVLSRNLEGLLVGMMERARPRKWPWTARWIPLSWSTGTGEKLQLPRYGRELLMLPLTIPEKVLVGVMIRLADPLLVVLETARSLKVIDEEGVRAVFHAKFRELYPRAEKLTMKEPISFVTPWNRPKGVPITIKVTRGVATVKGADRKGPAKRKKMKPIEALGDGFCDNDDKEKIQKLQKRLERLWDECSHKYSPNSRIGSSTALCLTRDFISLKEEYVAKPAVMDAFLALYAGPKVGRIPADTFANIESGNDTKLFATFRRAGLLIGREKKLIIFPISMGNMWILAELRLHPTLPAELTIFSPVKDVDVAVEKAGNAILNAVSRFHEHRDTGDALEWQEIVIIHGQSTNLIESSGMVMARVIELVTNEKVGCKVALLTAAIGILTAK